MIRRLSLLATLLLTAALPARAEGPKVITTLQPVHSLTAMVMQGVGTPDVLISGTVSEHGFTLKPSDARKLAAADLVVLVDPSYESFVRKSLTGKGPAAVLAWASLPGIIRLPPREGGAWEEDAHDHDKQGHDKHGHDKQGHDPHDHDSELDGHLWLNPQNAVTFVQAMAERLSQLDPAHAAQYADNAQTARQKLTQLDQQVRQMVQPLAERPFVVFHDAYHYFEQHYGLKGVGSVTVDPDRPPSAKRLARLRDKLKGQNAACIFAEPQFPSPLVQTIAQSAGIRQGVLDPQGATLPPGPDLYPALLTNLARNMRGCLLGE